ncbi:MAG TPA: exodeoxyribonuclease V subunit gamma [Acidimicrobiales bacterium]|nr:exodeoxyribonuclease V subunit gamma [Acidimicrobiales bacterium]
MLHLHRAERADVLVEALGALVAEPLADPLETEVVAVPTRGVERWLTQRLSGRLGVTPGRSDGVCANVEFPFPGRLVGGAVAAAAGVDRDDDPWLPERSVWPLLEVVDACLAEPWLSALAAHLGGTGADAAGDDDAGRRARRFTTVRHIADLYDRYGVHRPAMLRRWAAGDDTDGEGRPLREDADWQAVLWRHLRQRIASPSPAERLDDACAVLGDDASRCDLPHRLSLFGLTRLPASYLQVLDALAVERDVHLFLLHPSPVLWERVAEKASRPLGIVRRSEDDTAEVPRNPLLSSWGRDAREMQLVLTAGAGPQADHHRALDMPAATLLQRIQADVRADRSPPGLPLPGHDDTRPVLGPADRSVQVHSCHGQARQVEVLRDAILHVLAEDETLEPRDVIVMCPDIETFAPLIHATFGAGAGDVNDAEDGTGSHGGADAGLPRAGEAGPPPRADLRVRLADRSLRQTNPLLGVVSELLALADARLTASQVLDLAGRDPVRRRFRLDDDDLARTEEWVSATGVRWGLDAGHRAPFKLDRLDANTWRSGLDRVLLGVAMAEEGQRLVGGVLPLDDVDSSAIDLAGRLAELLDRLHTALAALGGPQTAPAWAAAIADAADALAATSEADSWQRAQLGRLLDEVVHEATVEGATSPAELALPEIRALLADRLRGRPTRANFRTGHLTICTLVPMRSVPHRVVCLLGLDDGVFPRKTARDGDDLILDDPYVGDRDARSEDRQLLLDALLAATDQLVVTYAGRDERTNAERPPAVPVGELLDVVDRTVRTEAETEAEPGPGPASHPHGREQPASHRIVVQHPLQPFDVRNFTAGKLIPGRPWSFDAVALDGARALSGKPPDEPPPFLAGRLPPATGDVVELDELARFVQHPVRAFLRQRLGISVADYSEDVNDAVPVELGPLEQWGVGDRLLAARLAGAERDTCVAAEIARGILPPGALARPVLDRVCPTVEDLVAAATELTGGAGDPRSIEVALPLPDGRLLVGTVPGVRGTLAATVVYSRVGPKHRLASWARFLALTAAHPGAGFEAATVGRRRADVRGRARVTIARIAAFDGDPAARRGRALVALGRLVELYDRGMCEPLPLYCATSAAHATARAAGKDSKGAEAAARKVWESEWDFPREDKEDEHLLVLGGARPFGDLLQAPPCDDEEGEGWAADEPTRFGRYARRLWDGLLECETLVDR